MMDMLDVKHKDFVRGLVYVVGGITLLLYSLGIIERGITTLLVILSLVLILYGVVKAGLYEKIQKMLR